MTALGDHARDELELISAPQEIADPLIGIVGAFADVAPEHWPIMREYLDKLLHFQALSDLTNNPAEWNDKSMEVGVGTLWQNKRDPDAVTKDPTFARYSRISELNPGATVIVYPTAQYTPPAP